MGPPLRPQSDRPHTRYRGGEIGDTILKYKRF